ncbi:hypothetical protein C8Q77DRAFT_912724 [Trametes polyzona]|nr:hypothetical protein C8Q77DRAFT_912724 [Trametes polyzona]
MSIYRGASRDVPASLTPGTPQRLTHSLPLPDLVLTFCRPSLPPLRTLTRWALAMVRRTCAGPGQPASGDHIGAQGLPARTGVTPLRVDVGAGLFAGLRLCPPVSDVVPVYVRTHHARTSRLSMASLVCARRGSPDHQHGSVRVFCMQHLHPRLRQAFAHFSRLPWGSRRRERLRYFAFSFRTGAHARPSPRFRLRRVLHAFSPGGSVLCVRLRRPRTV